MLTNRPIATILPVLDIDRARCFYVETLGLRPTGESSGPEEVTLEGARGSRITLDLRDKPTKAEHTAVTFDVDDVKREVRELEERGVRFEDYDLPGLHTEAHIARVGGLEAAWFKDPDGNILSIHHRDASKP